MARTEEALEQLEKLFDEADKDENQKLGFPEFQKLVAKIEGMKASVTDTEALFKGADENKSESITKDEFLTLARALLENDEAELSKNLFRAYDVDNSGFLEFKEVQKLYTQFGNQIDEDTAKKICADYGTDEKISFPELYKQLFNKEVPKEEREAYKEEKKESSKCCLLI